MCSLIVDSSHIPMHVGFLTIHSPCGGAQIALWSNLFAPRGVIWSAENMYILPNISFRTSIYKPALAEVIDSHRYLLESARNWKLYLEVLEAMMPVFFATNRYRYSKWLTVHIHGITVVVGTASEVYAATAYGLEQEKPSVIICYIFDQIQRLRGM